MRALKKFVFYFLIIFVSLVFFLLWVFPYDQLSSWIKGRIEASSKGRFRVEWQHLGYGFPKKFHLENLQIFERDNANEVLWVEFTTAEMWPSILSGLRGNLSADFELIATPGTIRGDYEKVSDGKRTSVVFDNFPLAAIKGLPAISKFRVLGSIDGQVNAFISEQILSKNTADLDLKMSGLRVESSGLLALLPSLKFDLASEKPAEISAKLEKNILDLKTLQIAGKDLTATLKGRVSLNNTRWQESRLNLEGKFRLGTLLQEMLQSVFSQKGIRPDGPRGDGFHDLKMEGSLKLPVKTLLIWVDGIKVWPLF